MYTKRVLCAKKKKGCTSVASKGICYKTVLAPILLVKLGKQIATWYCGAVIARDLVLFVPKIILTKKKNVLHQIHNEFATRVLCSVCKV